MSNPSYIADNPDVLAAARAVLQARLLKSQGSERAALIQSKWAKFTNAAFSPSVGSPDARMTLIEFTDYTCAPCKASAEAVRDALANNKDLRVVIMILPIGGSNAEFAARVAFAAYKQNPTKFWELHRLLMAEKGELTEAAILRSVSQVGLDSEQIHREVTNPENWSYLEQVRMFAQDLQVVGVPAFVLGQQLVFGGVTTTTLGELIRSEQARIDSSNPKVAEVR
ncbi:DsbA family protein [Paraburkholderia sp.]|uniref:DsbA family protein n=1 Tax=Paraburkholderia sp. TaxID=1926495 RepID=UPI003C7E0677